MANDILINNLKVQMERLVNQTEDLTEHKDDLDEEEYNCIKQETLDQIVDFGGTLDRLTSGDVSLYVEVSAMKTALRQKISSVYNTGEMRKIFGHKSKDELKQQLLQLQQDLENKTITKADFDNKKKSILEGLDGFYMPDEILNMGTEDMDRLKELDDD